MEERESTELWSRDHQTTQRQQSTEEFAISIDLAGLTRRDCGRADRFEVNVFRCHGPVQNLLPFSCANHGNGSANVLTVPKSLPRDATRDIPDSSQTARKQMAPERTVVGEPTPRLRVRERFLTAAVGGNYSKATWPAVAAIAYGGSLVRAHIQRFHQVQRSLCAWGSGAKESQH